MGEHGEQMNVGAAAEQADAADTAVGQPIHEWVRHLQVRILSAPSQIIEEI